MAIKWEKSKPLINALLTKVSYKNEIDIDKVTKISTNQFCT